MTLWQKPATVARIRHVNELVAELIARHSGTIAACQFLLASASPPRFPERNAIRAGLRRVAAGAQADRRAAG